MIINKLIQAELRLNKALVEIATDRLILRKHRMEDFTDCARLWANPTVTRYIGGQPLSEENTWAKFLRNVGHWSMMGFGYWIVREKITENFVGEIGFADHKRDILSAFSAMPEMGWVLDPAFHGRGYAAESVGAALKWADQYLPSQRTVCLIDPENFASIRLAQKMGYHEFARANYQGELHILFERYRQGDLAY